ncbi:MAG: hypothetical protein HZA19_04575 [Nitrospirae bacterium]|nr:hypothetical protein [Nitrospirota bacterium]
MAYTGSWTNLTDANESGGTYKASNTTASTATFSFVGIGIFWMADPWSDLGKAKVYMDGVLDATVSTYSPSNLYQIPVYSRTDLDPGPHTLTIEVTGTNVTASTDTFVDIDAFDVVSPATRYEETNGSVTYAGTWSNASDTNASGGSYQSSSSAGASATFTFTGSQVSWISDVWWDLGIANVYIDGVLDTTVDLYNPANLYQQVVYTKSGLVSGTHTIKIEVTGTKNAASGNDYIDLDAFDVTSP